MGYDDFWKIFEETGDIEDYLEYVNHGEYYASHDSLFSEDESEFKIAFSLD